MTVLSAQAIREKIHDAKFQGLNTYFVRESCDSTPIRIINARVVKDNIEVRGLNSGLWYRVSASDKIYNA